MIKAPYNFVPLEEKAFYPDWADNISHDKPFEDGVSGCIAYTMQAETPIFVRNGYPNAEYPDRKHPGPTFSHSTRPDGLKEYFIPGTSIKGEIRNVLEILSFGKMTQVQNARFGIREFVNKYGEVIAGVHCGWMWRTKDDDGKAVYRITDCGTPYRIKPEDIDNLYKTRLYDFKVNFTSNNQNVVNGDSLESAKDAEKKKRSALYKYDNILGLGLSKRKDCASAIKENLHIYFDSYDKNGEKIATHISKDNKNGLNSGTIILTGQPGPRKRDRKGKWTGKYYEFVFPDPKREAKSLDITQEIADDFITIHKNNYDFEHLWDASLHYGYGIPVFFKLTDGKVDAIGLSGMFRIPSANFIKGAIPADLQSESRKDLAECIFGTSNNSLGFLKGRVTFSPAFACGEAKEIEKVKTTLSSPKPSYGPLYVKGGTWNDSKAQIKGRKRYPVRNEPWTNDTGNGNTETTFIPLDKGVEFAGKIYFHNLRKCELGALISALTFDGHNADRIDEVCFHSIGEAKPLGYGKVRIDITDISVVENEDMASSLNEAFNKMTISNTDDKANPASEKEADSPINNCQPSTNGSGWSVNDCKSSDDDSIESGKRLNEKKELYLTAFRNIMMTEFNSHWKESDSLKELFAMAKGIPGSVDEKFRYMEMSTDRNGNEFSSAKTNGEILPMFSDILKEKSPGKGYKQDWKRKYECDLRSEVQAADKKAITEKAETEATDKIKKAKECLENNEYGSALEICAYLLNIHNLSPQTKKHIEDIHNDALRLKEDTEAKNRLQELKDEVNAIFDRAKEADGDEKAKYLNEFLTRCKTPELQKDTDILNKIQFCENELKRLKRSTNSIETEFETYRLASLKAFAEKLRRWLEASSTTNLNDSQLTFLSGVIRSGISHLNNAGKRDWSNQKKWENIFNGILSHEEIQAIFNNASKND